MKELQEMWKQVLLKVEMMVSAVSFDLWIAPLEVLDYNRTVKDLNGLSKEEFLKAIQKKSTLKKSERSYLQKEILN